MDQSEEARKRAEGERDLFQRRLATSEECRTNLFNSDVKVRAERDQWRTVAIEMAAVLTATDLSESAKNQALAHYRALIGKENK